MHFPRALASWGVVSTLVGSSLSSALLPRTPRDDSSPQVLRRQQDPSLLMQLVVAEINRTYIDEENHHTIDIDVTIRGNRPTDIDVVCRTSAVEVLEVPLQCTDPSITAVLKWKELQLYNGALQAGGWVIQFTDTSGQFPASSTGIKIDGPWTCYGSGGYPDDVDPKDITWRVHSSEICAVFDHPFIGQPPSPVTPMRKGLIPPPEVRNPFFPGEVFAPVGYSGASGEGVALPGPSPSPSPSTPPSS